MKRIALLIALSLLHLTHAAEKPSTSPTDFTSDNALPFHPKYDWTLGPTGARGWYHTANGHSHAARQILVTEIAAGAAAEGVLEKDDVILGVNGSPFTDDARVQFANAITTAEAGNGRLSVRHWRAGAILDSTINLPALGQYSSTAPYDCEKSRRIVEEGCASLARRMAAPDYAQKLDAIPRTLNALALLASGKKEYLPLVAKEAAWASEFTTNGYLSWYYGYLMMFVSEYVMATGDASVMPGLKRLALETAKGRSGVGTWGHRFATDHGNLGGYGAMNQPGLSLTIGMVLAREAGVSDPELDRAIDQSAAFLRWWMDKGAIPYGDHQPFPAHEDNGKCAAGAVLFDLLGDREAADFFAKMTTAAFSERERGHTGNYFNHLWALLGVARCGPHASGAYLKEQSWHYDFARGKDHNFRYQPSPEGAEEYRAYIGWDCSGSNLLSFALPLRSLRITGKKPFVTTPLNQAEAQAVIDAGKHFPFKDDPDHYLTRSTDQLLAALGSWSPFVRKRAANALGQRADETLPTLIKMLDQSQPSARYGAIEAIRALGARANPATDRLRAALRDADPWIQCLAADAITYLGQAERKSCVGDLLSLTVTTNAADPRRHTALAASIALFKAYPGARAPNSILQDSLDGVDRSKLYPALQTLLKHEDSIARGTAARAFKNLTDDDLLEMLPHIVPAIRSMAPSNEMFADGVRLEGINLLSRLHIREGMQLCVDTIEPDRWGERNRSSECLNYLQRYGIHAKSLIPQLREIRTYLANVKKAPAETIKRFDERIAAIDSATDAPTLVDLPAFKKIPSR